VMNFCSKWVLKLDSINQDKTHINKKYGTIKLGF
jgi:hypothetical protein